MYCHIQHYYIVISSLILIVVPFFCLTIYLLTIFFSHPYPACTTPQPLLFCSVKGQIYWDERSLYLPSCLNCSSQSHCEARWSRQGVERWSREGQCLHTDECTGQSVCRHIERLSRICAVYLCTSEHSWKTTAIFYFSNLGVQAVFPIYPCASVWVYCSVNQTNNKSRWGLDE